MIKSAMPHAPVRFNTKSAPKNLPVPTEPFETVHLNPNFVVIDATTNPIWLDAIQANSQARAEKVGYTRPEAGAEGSDAPGGEQESLRV